MRFADGLLCTLSLTCGLPERPVSYAHIFICGPMVAPRVRRGPKFMPKCVRIHAAFRDFPATKSWSSCATADRIRWA